MDLSGFMRRFSQSSGDSAASVHHLPTKPQGLTVDTSVMKESQRMQPQWGGSSPINIAVNHSSNHTNNQSGSDSPPGSGRTSASATPTSTRSVSDEHRPYVLQRRRSNSECLMLARDRGGQNLPGPCQEYIAGVKQILARSEESQPALLRRRSSMSLKGSPLMSK